MHQEYVLFRNEFKQRSSSFLQSVFSFLISTSLFLSISGSLKVYFSFALFNAPVSYALITATFFMILGVYGINKLTDLKEDLINTPERAKLIVKIGKVFKLVVISSFIVSLVIGSLTNLASLPVLLTPLFAGILYSIRLSPSLPRLKDITAVKNIIIALSWGVVATFLPAICYSESLTAIMLIFYFFTLRSFINSVLFDVRDVEGDRKSNIPTIPVTIGVKNTKKLLLVLNASFIPWLILSYYLNLFSTYVFATLAFATVYSFAYIIHFCNSKKIGKSLDLLVDGEWIILVAILLILKTF